MSEIRNQSNNIEPDAIKEFKNDCINEVNKMKVDSDWNQLCDKWIQKSAENKYSYHFNWLGRPIIQYPQDIVMLQQIIFNQKPDAILETGIAHGGSLILSASLLELNAVCGGDSDAFVLGLDIDIRKHNLDAINNHTLKKRIKMLQGSSIDENIISQAKELLKGKKNILVLLDSNHTHEHVLAELNAFSDLVPIGGYLIVFDTVVEKLPKPNNRPWYKGNSPGSAVSEFLKSNDNFEVDEFIDATLGVSAAPGGYLRRVK